MLRAVHRGRVLAEVSRTVRMEGNHYFPPESLNSELFVASGTRTLCPWKGVARYYTLVVDDDIEPNVAWSYRHPSPLARRIKNHMAFDSAVVVEGEPDDQPSGIGAAACAADGRSVNRRTARRDASAGDGVVVRQRGPSVWGIGLAGGTVGMLCCVGPTVLALFGVVGAGTAFSWATDLYAGYAWPFRLGGLAVMGGLVWWSLRRRQACSLAGMRHWRRRLLGGLAVGIGTYAALYALTTWLGTFA